jgi:chromosome segregation ATPase
MSNNGVRAARSLGAGEPSPDVLFSRRPSTKGPATKTTKTTTTKNVSKNITAQATTIKTTKTTKPTPKPTPKPTNPTTNASKTNNKKKHPSKTSKLPPPSLPQSPRSPTAPSTCTCQCSNCSKDGSSSGSPSTSDGKLQLAEIAKLRAELSSFKQKRTTLQQKCTALETLVQQEQTRANAATLELAEASKNWSKREQELVAAGTSTLSREKNMEEQANVLLAQLSSCQKELEQVKQQQNEGEQTAQVLVVSLKDEANDLNKRLQHLEEINLEYSQTLESTRNSLESNKKIALETQEMLVSAAWTEAEEQMKKEQETTQRVKHQVVELTKEKALLKQQLNSAEQLPNQLRDMLEKKIDQDLMEDARIDSMIDSLKNEIKNQAIEIQDRTKERDDLMERLAGVQQQIKTLVRNAKNMKAEEFEDTYEAVMREEFEAMRGAYEDKLKVLREQVAQIRHTSSKAIDDHAQSQKVKIIGLKSELMKKTAQITVLMKEQISD